MNKSLNFRNDGGPENRDDDPRGGGIDSRFRMVDGIDEKRVPRHIAIIMDGNGRWARQNALGRISGHREGAESVRVVVEVCRKIGVPYLTLFAFSVENWMRPNTEVRALMRLLVRYLRSELKTMLKNDIRLKTIGNVADLPENVRTVLEGAVDATKHCKGMVLNLALSYGGRDDIVGAVKKIIKDSAAGKIKASEITRESFEKYLSTRDIPDPDLLIRTSGEFRISNFLLWQSAYTELYFTDVFWPDFREPQLIEAILDYQKRERRFGKTGEQLPKESKE